MLGYRYIIYTLPIAYEIGTTLIKYDRFGFILGIATASLNPLYNYVYNKYTNYGKEKPTEEQLLDELRRLNSQMEDIRRMECVLVDGEILERSALKRSDSVEEKITLEFLDKKEVRYLPNVKL